MNYDEYGEVINGVDTYREIAKQLFFGNPILIGWTDEDYTHYDILFVLRAKFAGTNIQGGIRGNDLFVSIMRRGAFGFEVNSQKKSSGYLAEKLYVPNCSTSEKLADLVNGVIEELMGGK